MSVEVSEAKWLINFILTSFDNGLLILLGAAEPPSAAEIADVLPRPAAPEYGCHIDGGEKVPYAESVLSSAEKVDEIVDCLGGWKKIAATMRDYRRTWPKLWGMFESHALFIRPGGKIRDGQGGMGKIVGEYYDGVTERTVWNRRNQVIDSIALYLVSWSYTDGWNLTYHPGGREKYKIKKLFPH